jgi:hypothetical protein
MTTRSIPLLLSATGLFCVYVLGYIGAGGYAAGLRYDEMGTGLIGLVMLAFALWAAAGTTVAFIIWKRWYRMNRRGSIVAVALTIAAMAPPAYMAFIALHLMIWSMQHG